MQEDKLSDLQVHRVHMPCITAARHAVMSLPSQNKGGQLSCKASDLGRHSGTNLLSNNTRKSKHSNTSQTCDVLIQQHTHTNAHTNTTKHVPFSFLYQQAVRFNKVPGNWTEVQISNIPLSLPTPTLPGPPPMDTRAAV